MHVDVQFLGKLALYADLKFDHELQDVPLPRSSAISRKMGGSFGRVEGWKFGRVEVWKGGRVGRPRAAGRSAPAQFRDFAKDPVTL